MYKNRIVGAAAFMLVGTALAVGQVDLGSVSGTITDASGAILPNATVTIVNTATGSGRTIPVESNGQYTAVGLPIGPYKVTISAPGFSSTASTFVIATGSANKVDAKLTIGNQETVIDVAANNFSGVNTENQEVSQVVDEQQVSQFPSLTRNPYDFTSLSGFASTDPSAAMRGVGLNLSGSRSSSVDILLDGAENTDLYAVGVGQAIPLDGVSQYRVITSNFGPEYGRASGGIVNVSTKSGTNAFHGTAYEFNRISTFASNGYNNNALGVAKSRFTRNQFGYSVGGPIFKDKLFFFSTTEFVRVRSNATVVAEVPDAALIAGSATNTQQYFTTYGTLAQPKSGKTYSFGYLAGVGLPAGTPAPGPFSADAAALIASGKFSAATPAFDEIIYQQPGDSGAGVPQNTYNLLDRVDYAFSSKTTITGRYALLNSIFLPGSNSTSPYAGYSTGASQNNNNGYAAVVHTFSPTLTMSAKLLFTRFTNAQPLGTAPVSPTLYVNTSTSQALGSGTIYFPGYEATSPGNALPFGGPQNEIQPIVDMTKTLGRHTIIFGGEFIYLQDNRVFGASQNASAGLVQTGNAGALNNFVAGNLGALSVAINPQGKFPCIRSAATAAYNVTPGCTLTLPVGAPSFSRSNRYKDYAAYAGDSFRVSPRLTLSYGLRWEVYGPQHSNNAGLDSNFYPGANGGGDISPASVRGGQVLQRSSSPSGQLWKTNYKQFAPRLGFALDVTGDGKTSLTGGYGISYERNFNNVTYNVIQNPPNYAVVLFTSADNAGVPIPISTNNFGTFGTGTGTKFLPNVTLRAVDPNIKPSYNHFYSMTVQRQIASNTTALVEYTGERGIHNYSIANVNRSFSGVNYNGDSAPLTNRSNLQYSNINFRGADGDSYYNGLNIGLRSSNLLHQGITITANYTLGHSTDNTSSTFTDGGSNLENLGYLDPYNHALDHGNSDFDVRNRISTGIIWEIPYAKRYTGVAKRVLDGWSAAPIFIARTGTPFTIFDCSTGLTVCPRATPNVALTKARTGDQQDLSGVYGPNTFGYITEPAYSTKNAAGKTVLTGNYTQFVNPKEVIPSGSYGDLPICTATGCSFPAAMTARNAFRGPGSFNLDLGVYKSVAITEKTSLQLRFEGYNFLNHANTILNLGGASDISTYNSILAYKSGRRQVQLAAKFVF